MDPFSELLEQLSEIWQISLYADKGVFCRLHQIGKPSVQIEYQESKERLLIASFLCEVPAGKYRENLFKTCLKSNFHYPRVATLSYSERNNQLTLFTYVSLHDLNGAKLAKILENFFQKAHEWKKAVESGSPLPEEKGGFPHPSSS